MFVTDMSTSKRLSALLFAFGFLWMSVAQPYLWSNEVTPQSAAHFSYEHDQLVSTVPLQINQPSNYQATSDNHKTFPSYELIGILPSLYQGWQATSIKAEAQPSADHLGFQKSLLFPFHVFW